jgi:hypothetical protein
MLIFLYLLFVDDLIDYNTGKRLGGDNGISSLSSGSGHNLARSSSVLRKLRCVNHTTDGLVYD